MEIKQRFMTGATRAENRQHAAKQLQMECVSEQMRLESHVDAGVISSIIGRAQLCCVGLSFTRRLQ